MAEADTRWLDVMAEQVAIYDYRCRKFEAALRELRTGRRATIERRDASHAV